MLGNNKFQLLLCVPYAGSMYLSNTESSDLQGDSSQWTVVFISLELYWGQ